MDRGTSYNCIVIVDKVDIVKKSNLNNEEQAKIDCNENILTKRTNRVVRDKRPLNIQKLRCSAGSYYNKFCSGCSEVKKDVNKSIQSVKPCNTSQTVTKNKSANKEKKSCHDTKFKLQCKVLVEKVDITELVKKSELSKIRGKVNKQLTKCNTSQTVNQENKMYHDSKFKLQCKVIVEKVDITEYLNRFSEEVSKGQVETDYAKSSLPKSVTYKVPDKISLNTERSLDEFIMSTTSRQDVATPAPAKCLRIQVKPNYAELTLDTSQEKTPDVLRQVATTKVPVYRQQIKDKQPKKPNNLYDFDESDSDRDREKKKGKGKAKKLDDSSFHIPRARKARARVKQKAKMLKVLKSPTRKYDDIIQGVLQRVMQKVDSEQKQVAKDVNEVCKTSSKETNIVTANKNLDCTNTNNLPESERPVSSTEAVSESHKKIHTVDISSSSVSLDISCDEDNIQESVIEHAEENMNNKNGTQPQLEARVEKPTIETIIESSIAEVNRENVTEQHLKSPASPHPSEIIDASFDEDDDRESDGHTSEEDDSFLGFLDNIPSAQLKSTPRINIISDVVVQQKNGAQRKAKRPTGKHSPWRFNDFVKRNPHFIILKNTALPCLKQDMVLDHNQLEKIEEHFSKTPRRVATPKKSPVQKSILDYVDSPRHDKENVARSSLFDYDDFSPIKMRPAHNLRSKAKRNILGPIQDNAANILPMTSTPAKNRVSFGRFIRREEDEEIGNYFGFDDEDETNLPRDKDRPSEAKPFRLKGYPAKKQPKEVVEEKEVEDLPVQEPEQPPAVDDGVEVQLFEDLEQAFSITVPSKIYQRKPRRKRLKSVDVENEEEHPKKRKKDMMTKAEEAALEDWAEKFNSMCKEIEKYNLEIE